ncbi:hypothetical protein HSB1_37260 [Halogranum salarium B-1]|uniref:Uncharacterized protein n=1 Tax=Halogranum salarium B-1 TaxID=1210908 RepID=J3JEF2_9EURY|nr:hypothetical protein HSB1_37260 [Halogranum salarium B-1]
MSADSLSEKRENTSLSPKERNDYPKSNCIHLCERRTGVPYG